jgi:hypothetical protein
VTRTVDSHGTKVVAVEVLVDLPLRRDEVRRGRRTDRYRGRRHCLVAAVVARRAGMLATP